MRPVTRQGQEKTTRSSRGIKSNHPCYPFRRGYTDSLAVTLYSLGLEECISNSLRIHQALETRKQQ